MDAVIFDINRFAIHDGGGIRSTLFFKGCPLNCPWCQNPEGKKKQIELKYFKNNCIRCGICVEACPHKALKMTESGIKIDKALCRLCGSCTQACPGLALRFDGRQIDVAQAAEELLSDKLFYEVTGGGVTLSGGEPTLYADFCVELLDACRRQGLNTAIETCMYAEREDLIKLIPVVDTFYTDIKIIDPKKHLSVIGVPNDKILENFKMLANKGVKLVVRIPLIPGFTADAKNIRGIGAFVAQTDENIPVELINHNPLARNKYAAFNLAYPVEEGAALYTKAQMDAFRQLLISSGIKNVL